MSAHSDWWLHNNSLTPRHAAAGSSSPRMGQMQPQHGPSHVLDKAGDEIFGGARRGHGWALPTAMTSPFGRDEEALLGSPRPFRDMSPRQQQYASKLLPNEQSVAYIATNRPGKNTANLDTSWRTGDLTPFALDNSPRGNREMPVANIAKDPDLAGYSSKGTAGYGSEMLFGFKSPERPNLDLQVAQWRLGPGTNDPNPFTIDGSVPAPSPRRDPGRKLQRELMVQFGADDTLAREAARGEMARYDRGVERMGGVDPNNVHQGEPMGFFPSPRPRRDPSAPKQSGGSWRTGDTHPLTFDGEIIPRRYHDPNIHTEWRQFDKDGVGENLKDAPSIAAAQAQQQEQYVAPSHLAQNKSAWRMGTVASSTFFAPRPSPLRGQKEGSPRGSPRGYRSGGRNGGDSSSEASPTPHRPPAQGMARLLPGLVPT